jgi:5-formyltetrahydrofolate cyclo-ligase
MVVVVSLMRKAPVDQPLTIGRNDRRSCAMADGDGSSWPVGWMEIARWRKAERARLIAARLAIPNELHAHMARQIAEGLEAAIGDIRGRIVSLYWPFRGEPDMRSWMASAIARGGTIALPVAVEKARPLIFRAYRPGDRLEKGIWNIPVPADGASRPMS